MSQSQMPTPIAPFQKRSRLWHLEALRGLAALHVLLNHVCNSYLNEYFDLSHAYWAYPFRGGQEGVLIFFLLSGFVICYAHGGREPESFKTYLIKRGRRIYPIFMLSLLLAFGLQCVGSHQFLPFDFRSFFGNLFMLQDHPARPGVFMLPFADNGPLWSLSYEWWFYMMFYPINRWVPAPKQKYLVLGLCVTGLMANQFIPNSVFNFLILFLIWWAGVELAREFLATGDVTFRRQRTMLVLLLGPALWYGLATLQLKLGGTKIPHMEFPFMGLRYFSVAALFLLLFFIWKHWGFWGYRQTIGQFEWVGSISYALYVFHYPLIRDFRFFGGPSVLVFCADLFLRVLIAFGLAWLAEKQLQKWINAKTAPWLVSRSPSQAAGRPPNSK